MINIKFELSSLILACIFIQGCGIRYVADEVDYWQTPRQTRRRMQGDCEDISIKEYTIRKGAWMIWGTIDGKSHMWVQDSEGNTIDFIEGRRVELIRFNSDVYIKDGITGPACAIKKWCDVMERIKRGE